MSPKTSKRLGLLEFSFSNYPAVDTTNALGLLPLVHAVFRQI